MYTDLHNLWCSTLQVNTNYTDKFSWWRNADVSEITHWRHLWKSHRALETGTLPQERNTSSSSQRCRLPICRIWIRWTIRGSVMWRSCKNICWGSGVEAGGPLHHRSSECVVAYSFKCMFLCEWRTFWTYEFLVCFVCFIGTGFHKFYR